LPTQRQNPGQNLKIKKDKKLNKTKKGFCIWSVVFFLIVTWPLMFERQLSNACEGTRYAGDAPAASPDP